MASGLEHVAVFCDRLLAQGDARGELLALELAAAQASEVAESRRLNEAAQRLRARCPTLAWPPELSDWRGSIRAGMLVTGLWPRHQRPELPTAIGPHCRSLVVTLARGGLGLAALAEARSRACVRLDGLWEQRGSVSAAMVERHTIEHGLEIAELGLNRRLSAAAGLEQLEGLHTLELGHRGIPDDLLEQLSVLKLRRLGAKLDGCDQLRAVLDACPELEQLTLHEFEPTLIALPGLERLRHLSLFDGRPELPEQPRLADDLPLGGLDSLLISGPSLADLERLADFRLRALTVLEPNGDLAEVADRLAKLDSLERLTVIEIRNRTPSREPADAGVLSRLPRLRALRLVGRFGGVLTARPGLELDGLPPAMRVRGPIAALNAGAIGLENVLAHVDPGQVRTLAVSGSYAGGRAHSRFDQQLAAVEMLVLSGRHCEPALGWIGRLPRLRTVATPWLPFGEQQALAEQLPHAQIVGEDVARLANVWPDLPAIDPLAVDSWPRPAP